MKLFKRKKSNAVDPSIPPEVQAYSQAEHRERMGIAWLVGVVSLVLTAFVLAGLFFGGRWLYRSIAGPSNNDTQSQSTDNEQGSSDSKADKTTPENGASSKSEADSGAPNTTTTPQTLTPQPATTPNTGPGPDLPRTGPDSDE